MLNNNQAQIRKIYQKNHNLIMQPRGVDPYFLDWEFTPIEDALWGSIRFWSVPLYPEYPVLNYFVDFGNPYHRIALEADGKEWHDKEKDRERDLELLENGWKVFRVTGTEALRSFCQSDWRAKLFRNEISEREYWEKIEWWLLNTGDGVVYSLHKYYILKKSTTFNLVEASLKKHQSQPKRRVNLD